MNTQDEYRMRQIAMEEVDRAFERAGLPPPNAKYRRQRVFKDGRHTAVSYEYLPYGEGCEN